RFPLLLAIAVLTLAYFCAGKLSLHLAFLHASASPVWPATGIAIAALLVFGYRLWPGIFIGAFLVNLATKGTFFTSLGIGAGNTLEAIAGTWLIGRYARGTEAFERYQDVFGFAVAVLLAT